MGVETPVVILSRVVFLKYCIIVDLALNQAAMLFCDFPVLRPFHPMRLTASALFNYLNKCSVGFLVQAWYMVLYGGNEGDCLHAPWSLLFSPCNAPVQIEQTISSYSALYYWGRPCLYNSIQFNSIFIGPTMEEIHFEYMHYRQN